MSMHYIGVDVSKAKLDCAALVDEAVLKFRSKTFPNTAVGWRALLSWAVEQTGAPTQGLHFVLEATGVYSEAPAAALCRAATAVSVVNPAQVRDFAKGLAMRNKTDALDARVLARYGSVRKPAQFVPPPPEIIELKAMLSRLQAIEAELRRELNRLEKAQTGLSSPLVVSSIERSIAFLQKEKAALDKSIDDHIDANPQLKRERELLESIPAVGPHTSRRMLALMHSRTFRKASQLAAYIGLVPIHHESGSSVYKRPRLLKTGNAQIRAALYMAAVTATRHNPDVKAHYQRLVASGMAKLAAVCAAMRKLVHICFGVIKHQTPYQPQQSA